MSSLTTPFPDNSDVAEVIGGKAHSRALIMDPTGADAIGAVGDAPGSRTLLGRLKAIADAIGVTTSADSFFAITPGASALPTVPKAIYVTGGGTVTVKGADGNAATFSVPDQSILAIRPRFVTAATATGIIGLA